MVKRPKRLIQNPGPTPSAGIAANRVDMAVVVAKVRARPSLRPKNHRVKSVGARVVARPEPYSAATLVAARPASFRMMRPMVSTSAIENVSGRRKSISVDKIRSVSGKDCSGAYCQCR